MTGVAFCACGNAMVDGQRGRRFARVYALQSWFQRSASIQG